MAIRGSSEDMSVLVLGWRDMLIPEHIVQLNGHPVLFVPGNAGSSQQVRSIASSIVRQLYDSPYVPSQDLKKGVIAPVDVFAGQ